MGDWAFIIDLRLAFVLTLMTNQRGVAGRSFLSHNQMSSCLAGLYA